MYMSASYLIDEIGRLSGDLYIAQGSPTELGVKERLDGYVQDLSVRMAKAGQDAYQVNNLITCGMLMRCGSGVAKGSFDDIKRHILDKIEPINMGSPDMFGVKPPVEDDE